jgi:hypothetical protein
MSDGDDMIEAMQQRRQAKAAKASQKRAVILVGVALLVLVGGMIAVAVLLARKPILTNRPDVTMQAEEIMVQIAENPASTTKYQGKIVRLTGTLNEVTSNIQGQCFLTFRGNGRSPRCAFNDPSVLAKLKRGDLITVQGMLVTDGGMVDLSSCSLISP